MNTRKNKSTEGLIVAAVCAAILIVLDTTGVRALTADNANGPFLRMNSWMHNAGITQIATDKRGIYLASSSFDRTVRIWNIQSRQLMSVLRPPIAPGDEGILLTVAISPDGKSVVTGGHTKAGGSKNYVYVFDFASRKLVKQLKGGNEAIYFMTFSSDGQFLAVMMGKNEGLRIYRTEDWSIVKEDINYSDRSYWAEFSKAGWLVTSSIDGSVRLYDGNFDLVAKRNIEGNKEPFAATFSPDGERIAVGFTDSPNVAILSGHDLSVKSLLDMRNLKRGSFSVTAWSPDGKELYAAGEYSENGSWMVRRWLDAGAGAFSDIVVGNNTITDLRPLPGGAIAFSTLDPVIGFIASNEKVSYVRGEFLEEGSDRPDFRGNKDNFLISNDGSVVQFAYDREGKVIGRFSVFDRALNYSDGKERQLRGSNSNGLNVTDWEGSDEPPRLNGEPIAVDKHERSHSLSVAPGNEWFVLGTERHIYSFTKLGMLRWKVRTESIAWSVNISGNGNIAVAALSDGTIHWYGSQDGQELLTLFPHSDRRRWILWNSDWYYDVSHGAEDLIGWHINRGWNKAADFFPIQLFRDTYYRPDMINRTLNSQGRTREQGRSQKSSALPKLARTIALEKTPPVLRVMFPEPQREVATQDLVIKVGVRSRFPIVQWQAIVDGHPVKTEAPVLEKKSADDGEQIWRFVVRIPEKDCSVGIIGGHKYFSSEPATVPIKWVGKTNTTQGNLNILAIGISQYQKTLSIPALNYAHKDAKDLVDALIPQKGVLYTDVKVRLLQDSKATTEKVIEGLAWLKDTTTANDVAVLFMAGHGFAKKQGKYVFLPHDYDPSKPESTGISYLRLLDIVGEMESAKVVIILDTCRAGNLFGSDEDWSIGYTNFVNSMLNPKYGGVVFSAVDGKHLSKERPQNGYFTNRLVEGLSGAAALEDQEVWVALLENFVTKKVRADSFGEQIPTVAKSRLISDFMLAKKVTH